MAAAAAAVKICEGCKYWDLATPDPHQRGVIWESTRRLCRRFPFEIFKEPKAWCGEQSPAPASLKVQVAKAKLEHREPEREHGNGEEGNDGSGV